tara:strand:- start:439 stop:759 length:321 start_codon:yes stop_codon:yes gene_type:complete
MVLEQEIQEKLTAHREAKAEQTTNKDVVIEKEELEELRSLQQESDQVIVAFGQLAIQEKALKSQRESIESAFDAIKQKETELAKKLSDKYGQGTLDIESGKFSSKQ